VENKTETRRDNDTIYSRLSSLVCVVGDIVDTLLAVCTSALRVDNSAIVFVSHPYFILFR